ncbi:MAG: 2-oxoacid:acceptor oxidoreductase family protein [Armatimonadetes bacterium]|nr:2-oxoacid:acceptor oxidoreductase family protein [Armatimonadota bacterium]
MPDLEVSTKVAVRLSGTGGQGLLLAGRILAEAAGIYDGLNVVQTNSYGPEARGGASRSEVVMSKGEVDDLQCRTFDILIALSQKACDAYYGALVDHGALIVDSTNVGVVPTSRAIEIPMTKMAVEECGNKMVTNIIALGALCGFTNLVTLKSLESALKTTVKKDFIELNLKALHLGHDAARDIVKNLPERKRAQVRDYGLIWQQKAHKKSQKNVRKSTANRQAVYA